MHQLVLNNGRTEVHELEETTGISFGSIESILHDHLYTVDSLYLEVQGTLLNTLRYQYLDISDLQN